MKLITYITVMVIIAWTCTAVIQLWFEPLSGVFFFKLTVSAILIVGGMAISAIIFREYKNDKVMKENNYID